METVFERQMFADRLGDQKAPADVRDAVLTNAMHVIEDTDRLFVANVAVASGMYAVWSDGPRVGWESGAAAIPCYGCGQDGNPEEPCQNPDCGFSPNSETSNA